MGHRRWIQWNLPVSESCALGTIVWHHLKSYSHVSGQSDWPVYFSTLKICIQRNIMAYGFSGVATGDGRAGPPLMLRPILNFAQSRLTVFLCWYRDGSILWLFTAHQTNCLDPLTLFFWAGHAAWLWKNFANSPFSFSIFPCTRVPVNYMLLKIFSSN